MQQFDPNAFLDMAIDEAFEKRPPLPVGDYSASIADLTPRQWVSRDKTNADGSPKSGIAYDVLLKVQIPLDIREQLSIKNDELTLKDSIMLDMNDRGGLSTELGANRQLRNYREALDMNKPGVTFRPREMIGRMLIVKIKHEDYQGSPMERVSGVAALS